MTDPVGRDNAAAGVTVVITRRVKPGHEAAYEAALTALQDDGTHFEGYSGATTQRPPPGWPAPLRLLLTIGLEVALLTWWLMPRLTRWLAPWIYPRRAVV